MPAPRRHAHAVRRHPARRDEHVDDDQRHRDVAVRHVPRAGRGARRRPGAARGHDAERHREGVPVARHLHLRTRAVAPAHRRPRVPRGATRAEVEPDQRVLVPPAGGGRDAGRGGRVRAGDRDRRARRRARVGPGRRRRVPRGRRAHLVLRERGHPLRRGDVQAARVRRAVGPHHRRALRRDRREAAALPLRRAGELARAHRGAAREQRAAHRARGARRHPLEGRPGAARCSCRRGTRRSGCPGRGTSSGRCASSRCWPTRPTCSSTTTSSPVRTWSRTRPPSSPRRPRPSCSGCSTAAARSP